MAVDTLTHFAGMVAKLKMYPYFDIANYILMCMMVREDARDQNEPQAFSRKHPLSCWVSSMLMCFASVILTNLLTGESPIAPFTNHRDLLTASVVWYDCILVNSFSTNLAKTFSDFVVLHGPVESSKNIAEYYTSNEKYVINYLPFDIVYKLCKFLPIKVVIYSLKEVQRVNKIHHGIAFAMKHYPGAFPVICVIGVIKGAGYYYMRILDRLVRGVWIPTSNEILSPTLATKASLLASIAFILYDLHYLAIRPQILYLIIVSSFIFFRILYLVVGIHNPFHPFENLACGVFFGGMVDAFKRAVVREKPKTEEVVNAKGAPNKPKEE